MRRITTLFLAILTTLCFSKLIAQPANGLTSFFTNTTTALHANTACTVPKSTTLSGWLLSVSSSSNCGLNWTNSTGGDGRVQYLIGFGTLIYASFASDDGSEFALQNFVWGVSTSSLTSKPMQLIGYRNGSAVPGATVNATTPSGTGILNIQTVSSFTANSAFSNIDELRIVPTATCNSILFIEEINIGTAVPSCVTPTLSVSSQTNVSCNGGSNGSATFSASGGSPFTYTWSPSGGNAATATGLSAGIYTCVTTNSCGSTASNTVQITQPPSALATSTAVTTVSCNGFSNGVASITASGGTGGYTYLWSNGATTSAITGLLAGVYTSTVTDANNCTSIKSVLVTQPSALVTTTAVTTAICNGGTGSATITASGGAGGYTYLWSNGATTSAITGLLAGVYTSTVTDANSCTSIKSAVVTQPSALTTSTAVTNALCNGANGSATITASGGTGAYTYTWSSGPTTSVEPTLLAGTYTVKVTDANSCTSTKSVTITQPSALATSTAVTNISCNGGSNGVASITASGGTGAFSYLWSNGGTTSAITGLMAGVYTSTVTDANSCTSIKSAVVTQPSALVTSTAVTNIACNGGSNGVASITASGGAGGYTYLWSNGATTSAITGLMAGVYTSTVTDANSCTSIKSAVVTQPSALITTTAVTNVLCFGNSTGSATVTATGGTSPYTYLWSGAQTTSVTTSQIAGVKTVTVTDANSCTTTNTVTITQPSALITTTAVTNVLCNGNSTGSATVTTTGGTSPYTYLWSGAQTTSVTTSQIAGVKTVTVTDANSCTATNTVTITQPTALITTTAVTNVLCNGNSTGSATVTTTGGTSPYTYLWSGAQTTSVTTSQIAGVKTVTVTDANSCTATNTVTITQPTALSTSTAITNISCNGGSNGVATITATGGASGYTYLWSNGSTSATITGLLAGVYTSTVTDANGCTSIKNVTISQPSALITTTAVTNVLCFGNSTGSATVTASGGTSPYTYLWSGAQTTSVTTSQLAGVKTVTVTDANSCTTTNTVTIIQPLALITTTAVTNVLCFGNSTGSATVTASGGTSPYTYLWSGAQTTSVTTSQLAGVKTVTVTDANSCTTTNTVTITQPSALITTTAVTNVLCNGNSTGSATVTASGGTSPYTYLWSGAQTTSVTTSQLAGVKTVTVTDANSCTTTNTVTITQPTAISLTSLSQTNVSCNGGSNGAASVNFATGGTASYTYNWTPGNPTGDGTTSVTGLTAGNWTCTVTDANSCTTQTNFNITQPASALTTSTAVTNIACNGGSAGSATITATGGTGAYSYIWSNGATTSAITGLMAGAYTATVTDANSCTSIKSVSVTQPSALVTTTAVTNALCNGETGSSTIIATGGTGVYSYLWSNGATAATTTGLLAGVYTSTVTDANNCTSTKSVTITQPSAIVTTTAVTNVACNGGTGLATITATGGTSGYTYLWSNGATTATATGLLAGVYTSTVTDANSCVTTQTIDITEPAALQASANSGNILCYGGTTTVTVSANGGTSPYTGVGTFTQVAGTYSYTVTDANNCSTTTTITISEPSVLTATTSQSNITCHNACNGTATVTPTGGNSPYTFMWSNGNTTIDVNSLCVGNYTVDVIDANSCVTTQTIDITEPAALQASANSSNILCYGGTTTATVSATGGTSPYTGVGTFTQVAGTYSYTVTDANNCSTTTTITISEPSVLTATTSQSNITCHNACNGTATVTPTGGNSPYTFMWSNGNTTIDVNSLCVGNYTVDIIDANSCVTTQTIDITEPAALQASANSGNILCYGGTTTVTVSANGGASPYTGVGTFTQVAGTYSYTVTDANNCSTTTTIAISEPSVLTASLSASPITCHGGTTQINATTMGGTTPYSGTSPSIVGAGTYTYIISDANGCSITEVIVLNEPLAITNSQTITICSGQSITVGTNTYTASGTYPDILQSLVNGCDSNITTVLIVNPIIDITTSTSGLTISANEPSAAYQWIDCDNGNQPIINEIGQSFTASSNGNYAVIVTQNNCSDTSDCVSIMTTDLQNNNTSSAIKIYPNPSNDIINIAGLVTDNNLVEIYNALGELQSKILASSSSLSIDISNLSNGVYFIKVISNNKEFVSKLLKQQ